MEALTSQAPSVVIRAMTAADVDTVVAIEAESFTTPWQADTFQTLLDRDTVEMRVLEEDGAVVGYAVVWCILDQGELANIAIAPSRQGRGLAVQLLGHVMTLAASRGVLSMYLEVRVSNTRATALYQRFGFERVGRRKNYYDQPKEDAYLMVASLIP